MGKLTITKAALVLAAAVALGGAAAPALAEVPVLTPADKGPCRDPWINYAYRTQQHRMPVGQAGAGECNIYLYVGGHWQNYDQLRDGVNNFIRVTGNAGQAIRQVGGIFAMIDVRTGGQLHALVRALDQGGVGHMFDMMGQIAKSFGLMSTTRQTDLGGGSTLVVQ